MENKEWFYTKTVKQHFLKPKNICKDDKEAQEFMKTANGYGEAGNFKCGDIMRFWIKVDPKTQRIKKCRWQTWGCLLGSTKIMTPNGRKNIKDIKFGDYVWGWDGHKIVKTGVLNVKKREVAKEDILKISFNRKEGSKCKFYRMYVTKEHLFYFNGDWVRAIDLKKGDELFHLTEHEWRSLNNPGKYDWLKKQNSNRLKINNPMFNPETVNKTVQTYKQLLSEGKITNWMQTEYGKKVTAERMRVENPMFNPLIAKKNRDAQNIRPTSLEQFIIDLIKINNLPIRYVGDGKFWVTDFKTKKCKNPDFKVDHQRKLIEVYTSLYHLQKRDKKWVSERKAFFKRNGFKVLFLDMQTTKDPIVEIHNFLRNGEKIHEIRPISRHEYDQIKNKKDLITVYDLQLKKPHTYFSWRVLSHNCASAIASTSMLSVMITEKGGMKIQDALKIKPEDIAKRLGGLPSIKFHCSILGDQALRKAIEDYQKK